MNATIADDHGLRGYRNHGCRCDECRAANTLRRRQDRAAARDRAKTATFRHGTLTAYANRGCRCALCTSAKRADSATWYANNRDRAAEAQRLTRVLRGLPVRPLHRGDKEWLLANSYMTESGCWDWVGTLTEKGYGKGGRGGRKDWAHRLAWEIYYGPVGHGLDVDHLCRNRRCVNPDHLEPVTPAENQRRAIAARRLERAA